MHSVHGPTSGNTTPGANFRVRGHFFRFPGHFFHFWVTFFVQNFATFLTEIFATFLTKTLSLFLSNFVTFSCPTLPFFSTEKFCPGTFSLLGIFPDPVSSPEVLGLHSVGECFEPLFADRLLLKLCFNGDAGVSGYRGQQSGHAGGRTA